MADPWFKFYPTDWRADPALRMCSPAARGVWIDMICLMHEATPYGHLLVNGHCPTDVQLAVLLGLPSDQLSELKGELEAAGVFSLTREGVIYSRKMTRWSKKAATARRNGRKGGNPKLSKESENPALDNQQDKGQDKPQKPEARSQIGEEAKASSCSKPPEPARFGEFWDDAYPHRGGSKKGRKPSLAKYAAAVKRGVPEAAIIDGARRYRADRGVIDGYAKDPVTWLNQECWADDIEPQFSAINGGQHGTRPSAATGRLEARLAGARAVAGRER